MKTVYKLSPSDYWRIGELESWLSDMAAEGLFLKKLGRQFVKFEKADPKNMRYRVVVSISKEISAEQVDMYGDKGWDFVTSYGSFHAFSSPAELNAPELYTDPSEQSYSLKELDKQLVFNAAVIVFGLLLMIGMLASSLFLDGTPTLVMVEGIMVHQTLLAIYICYIAYASVQAAFSIRDLRKRLAEGIPIDHHSPWKKRHTFHRAITFLFTVVIGLSAIIPFVHLMKMDTKTLPEKDVNLPIVRLADVEREPKLERPKPTYLGDGVDWSNRYSFAWSLLAPVQYEADEHGLVRDKLWGDGSGEYSPSIHTQYYQLRFPDMAEHLITDLIKRYSFETNQGDFVEKKHPDLDLLIVREEKELKQVFATRGKEVMYVHYFGYADVNTVLDNVVEKMNKE
ncbi:DUF2812 domain-containing protein [Mesobacillus selenatarsenatis]|uniref:DUF2812 domain-containing protein n=1 Tax=Mesobacillus selenatarsenatis (strain DSM 18680 / JCM 14380 / FERM P-15431 / SF-1) TaxID=1321606 RepID=A0A0A8X1Z3_MESS1|nr:DUF2812 domain-containing protein [Mesobacillus selenatarsenatis]GAM12166.1 hypothetical protein SAMD00020551_0296 [Mesobacillus selenatarsenatis SF-1]